MSSEISDLCEISDLLLFVCYFASQSEGIKFGDYFWYVLRKLKHFGKMSDAHEKLQYGIKSNLWKIGLILRPQLFFFFWL